jgi:hypothetical protein
MFGLVFAYARRPIHQEPLVGDLCANDRSDIYLDSCFTRFRLERDRQGVAALVEFLRRDVGRVIDGEMIIIAAIFFNLREHSLEIVCR